MMKKGSENDRAPDWQARMWEKSVHFGKLKSSRKLFLIILHDSRRHPKDSSATPKPWHAKQAKFKLVVAIQTEVSN